MPSAPLQRWRRAVLAAPVSASTKGVALVLSVYVNAMGEGWPSKAELADGASVDVRTVDRAVLRLERLGLVEVERFRGRHRTNRYRLVFPFGENPAGSNGEVSFSEFQRVWITLGINPENPAYDAQKPGPMPGGSRKEVEKPRAPARAGAYARRKPRNEKGTTP